MQWQQEERQHDDTPRDANREGETIRAKEPDPYKPPGEDRNEGIPDRNNRGNRPNSLLAGDGGTLMGAAFSGHLARAKSREGNSERTSSSLHGCISTTNGVPVHDQGTTLPSPNEV